MDVVNFYPQPLGPLPWGKEPQYVLNKKLGGHHSQSVWFGEISCAPAGI
jgi:hypothetical protein